MELLSSEQIIEIIKRKGFFFVLPHYRFDRLRRKCLRMMRKGELKRTRERLSGHYGDHFVLPSLKPKGGEDGAQ